MLLGLVVPAVTAACGGLTGRLKRRKQLAGLARIGASYQCASAAAYKCKPIKLGRALDITRHLPDRCLGARREMVLRHVDRLLPQHHAQQADQCNRWWGCAEEAGHSARPVAFRPRRRGWSSAENTADCS
jgi:hypothetical protein